MPCCFLFVVVAGVCVCVCVCVPCVCVCVREPVVCFCFEDGITNIYVSTVSVKFENFRQLPRRRSEIPGTF